jgi:hypothetical protein
VNRPAYFLGGVLALSGTLLLGITGVWLLVSIPPDDVARQRAEIRLAALAAFGILGTVMIVGGALFFYLWMDKLSAWLTRDEWKQAVWPVSALLGVIAGAGVVLVGILPARADERDKPVIRRVVYGANLALTALLLVVALGIGNVIAALKLSNRLDVTESALAAISEPTSNFLRNLTDPVTVTLITRESERGDDVRRLLDRMVEESRGKLTVRTVHPEYNASEYLLLAKKFPPVERQTFGILLTVGDDDKRFRFIPRTDLFTPAPDGGRDGKEVFNGEVEMLQALSALAEGDRKSVVYFTQGAGELSVAAAGAPARAAAGQSAAALKSYLERSQLEVRPLAFDALDPKVPADAAVVVVANPQTPLSAAAAGAIRKYMTEPGPDKRTGRLMVLAGANETPPDGKVAATGLEPLLQEMGVGVGTEFVFGYPMTSPETGLPEMLPGPTEEAMAANNPVAMLFARGIPQWLFCRTVSAAPAAPGGPYQAIPLFESFPPGRPTWLEETLPNNPAQTFQQIATSAAVRRQKRWVENGTRPLAAVVTQGGTPRAAVFGCGDMVADAHTRTSRGTPHPNVQLVGATVDWLRERPAIAPGVVSKGVPTYTMNPTADGTRLVILPIALVLLAVAGLGVGVWVIRRK